jgi:hypothetical protein
MRSHCAVAGVVLIALCIGSGSLRAQDSPHGTLSVACDQCHDTQSWKAMGQGMKFDHGRTAFPLAGRHTQVACRQCHATLRFSEAKDRCWSCHTDVHRNELGAACERCHSTDSWLVPDMPQRHVSTRFALLGAHRLAQCRACHTNEQKHTYTGAPVECVSCHRANYDATTAPPHRAAGINTNCESCHAVSSLAWGRGFDHNTSGFPLLGAHAAVACSQCHQNNVYKGLTHDCYGCHTAQFNATATPPHQAAGFSTDCVQCHSASSVSWGGKFDHATTAFPLVGSHAVAACGDCHKNNVFKGLPSTCYSCHASEYAATTTPPHQASGLGTDCASCHSAASTTWGGKFNHATTGFPLNGSHAAVPCLTCHKNSVFKGLPSDCYSCHSGDFTKTVNPPHQSSGFGTDCVTCHGTGAANWAGSFNHSQTSFALTGRHVGVACTQCHVNSVYKGLATTCVSCHQQDYNASTNPTHTTSGFPTTCETCHSTSGWTPSTFNHEPSFPISSAAVHRPGRWTTCADCHTTASDFRVYACINCHEHAKSSMDAKHSGNSRYSYVSTACYNCHPRGRE